MSAAYLYGAQAGLSIWSGFQQASMIRDMGRFNERVAEFNAQFIERDAFEAEKFGFTQAARYQSVIDSTAANQRLAYAAADVDVNYGSAAEVQGETRLTGLLNILDIQMQGYEKARGLRREARNVRLGGFLQRTQAQLDAFGAQASGIMDAVGAGANAYRASGYGNK